jgi:hypothetical protein
MITIHAELIDYSQDINDYTLLVFLNLESNHWTNKYIMCVKFPNWDHGPIKLNSRGFLTYKEIREGIDKWYNPNSKEMVPYKYTNVQFIRFLPEKISDNEDLFI